MNLINLATEAKFMLWQMKDDVRLRQVQKQRRITVMENFKAYKEYLTGGESSGL